MEKLLTQKPKTKVKRPPIPVPKSTTVRVYSQDFLFNAGLVGFIDIVGQENVVIEDNYIEFDRQVFDGLSEKYFKKANDTYGRLDKKIKDLKEIISNLNGLLLKEQLEDKDLKLISRCHASYGYIKLFEFIKPYLQEKGITTPKESLVKKNPRLLLETAQATLDIIIDNYWKFFVNEAVVYLRRFYGQKSCLNKNMKNKKTGIVRERFSVFYEDFEVPLLNGTNNTQKHLCICCEELEGKKDKNDTNTVLDTSFMGINKDTYNFGWNHNTNLPLCEICEIIYFCSFAGLIDVSHEKTMRYFFINDDSSITNLIKCNNDLRQISGKDLTVHPTIKYFSQQVLNHEINKSTNIISNLAFIDMDLTNTIFPKISTVYVTKKKAKFLQNNEEVLGKLYNAKYTIKDTKYNVLIDTVDLILNDKLTFNYLNKLTSIHMSFYFSRNTNYKVYFSPYHIKQLHKIILKFLGRNEMTEEEINFAFLDGSNLARYLEYNKRENKIASISRRLFSHLKSNDVAEFKNAIIEIHMYLEKDVPKIFSKIQTREQLDAIGQSFLIGLLSKKYDKKKEEVTV